MMKQSDLTDVVLDFRLSTDAVRIVLDIARRNKGEHQIPMSHFRSLVKASDKVTAEAVKLAIDRKWITRRRGGRAQLDWFSFSPDEARSLIAEETGLNPSKNAGLNAIDPTENVGLNEDLTSRKTQGQTLDPSFLAGSNGAHARVYEEKKDVDVDGDDVAKSVLSVAATKAIDDNEAKLKGCRGSLADYLRARVKPDRQAPYVFSILGWLNGVDENVWRFDDGSKLEEDKRVSMLANALNDLAASDETKLSRPVGDVANLRTKINILLNPPRRRAAATTVGRKGPEKFDYSNATTHFRGFKK